MAVYREGYMIVEAIIPKQTQIYPDACDFGVPVKKGDSIWNMVAQLVDWYGVKGTREENRYSTGRSVSNKIQLINEWAVSDGIMSVEKATENFIVDFVSCSDGKCKGYEGYVSIQKI